MHGLLSMTLAATIGCQPTVPAPSNSDSSWITDEEVATAIRQGHPLPTDLPPMTVPKELAERNDEMTQEAMQIVDAVNAFTQLPWDIPPDIKSARQLKETGEWSVTCGPISCTFTKQQGGLTVTVTDFVGLPTAWEVFHEWDGCDGEHEYENFLVLHWRMEKNLKWSVLTHYQYPDPPPCDGSGSEIGPGPGSQYSFEILDEGTLYAGGEEIRLSTRKYTVTNHIYDSIFQGYLPFTTTACTSYPDDSRRFELHRYRSSDHLPYLCYLGLWSRDHKYCWSTYREDGTTLDCGGDPGCPDCGP